MNRSGMLCVGAALLSSNAAALAQSTDARASALEEIIVTAQKKEESLQAAPISIAAFGSAALERLGLTDLGDLQNNVPSLSMREMPSSKSAMRTFIRGVGNNDAQITQDPAVAIYLDGVYIARSTGLITELAEVERIEVLRGPQGTLYGRNATGGAINIISRKPDGEFGLRQTLSVGNFGLWRSATTVDLPAFGDLAVQLGYVRGGIEGWAENRGSGVDFNEEDKQAFRLAARWQPSTGFSLEYAFDHSDMDFGSHLEQTLSEPYAGNEFVPYGYRRMDSATPAVPFEASDLRIDGHSLTVTWTLNDTLTLKSLSGYRELEESLYQDYAPNPTVPRLFANAPFDTAQHQFTQEFQLNALFPGLGLETVAGLYYFEESGRERTTDYLYGGPLQSRQTSAGNQARAVFGQATWTPGAAPRWHFTLGARYSEDERRVDGTRMRESDFAPGEDYEQARARSEWSNSSLSGIVDWEFSDSASVYGKYTQGYRTGGFNGRALYADSLRQPVGAENVDSYELGLKAQWLDNRLRSNLALFRMRYEDMQLSFASPDDVTDVNFFNAGEAEIQGLELDLNAVPLPGLQFNAQYSFLDSEVQEVVDPQTGEEDLGQYQLPSAPEHNYTLDLAYTLPPLAIGSLTASIHYTWRDETTTTAPIYQTPLARIDPYGLWNARLELADIPLARQGELRLALWGRNLTDEAYLVDVVGSFPWSGAVGAFGQPRTYGLDLRYVF